MVKVGLVVRLVAKAGKEEEVAAFLAGAEPLARGESFTPAWFALRTARDVFWIVDAFASDADRERHLTGDIARAGAIGLSVFAFAAVIGAVALARPASGLAAPAASTP